MDNVSDNCLRDKIILFVYPTFGMDSHPKQKRIIPNYKNYVTTSQTFRASSHYSLLSADNFVWLEWIHAN